MAEKLIYILPMLLGRTFDFKSDKVGVDIFPEEIIRNPQILSATTYNSQYKVVKSLQEREKMLEVSGSLSLKIKAGMVGIEGSGSYLNDHSYKEDVVEILTVAKYITENHCIPHKEKPINGWDKLPKELLGTHYVRCIKYGGELIASLKYKAVDKKDFESIKATIEGNINAGETFDLVAKGKFDKLQKSLEGKASLEISYFANLPLRGVPHTAEGFKELILKFQDQVREVNNGLGVPISVELVELSNLNSKDFHFNKNQVLANTLLVVGNYFDDLVTAHTEIRGWLKSVRSTITEEQEAKIDKLYSEIDTILNVFFEAISKLDVEKGAEQMDRAIQAYKTSPTKGFSNKYTRFWKKMQSELIVPEESVQEEKAVYVRWGRTACNGTASIPLSEGHMALASNKASPMQPLCLPREPQIGLSIPQSSRSIVVGVLYGNTISNPFEGRNLFDQAVLCVSCLVTGRGTVVTLTAESECPEGWTMEYHGYVLSGRESEPESEAICVDSFPEMSKGNLRPENPQRLIMTVVYDGRNIPCVVCSK